MRQINNVALGDDWTAAATIENLYSGRALTFLVANYSASMQVQRATQVGAGGSEWSNEFLVNPTVGGFAGAIGVRFRNAVAGQNARIIAQIWEKSDPQPVGGSPFTGLLAASGQVSTSGLPSGTVLPYGGSTAPVGFVLCDGSTYDGTDAGYTSLWNAIGTTYGGTGQAAFTVPDLRGRVVVGVSTTGPAEVNALGDNDGVALASRNVSHHHTVTAQNSSGGVYALPAVSVNTAIQQVTSGDANNLNRPAYCVLQYIIAL